MPSDDKRYKFVRSTWQAGNLDSFSEIFDIVPRSVIAADLGINYERFTKKIIRPDKLTFDEVYRLAKLMDIDFQSLAALVATDIVKASKTSP